MKKIILGLIAISSISSMAFNLEANIKAGYDFYRSNSNITTQPYKAETKTNGRGFVVGAEIFPLQFLDESIKLGLGAEYNFGEKKLAYDFNNKDNNNNSKQITTFIPVYGAAKFTTYKAREINLRLYTLLRAGYVFMKSFDDKEKPIPKTAKDNGGLYYGLGIGVSKDWFLAEVIYDGRFRKEATQPNLNFHHKVGLRLGLQIGYEPKPEVIDYNKMTETNTK